MLKRIKKSTDYIAKKAPFTPEIGIILGSGLGEFINDVKVESLIPYGEIPDFPQTTVDGHSGNLAFAEINCKKVVIMQGRIHYYEGHPIQEIVFPVRVLKELGIKYLLLSNASGGMNPDFAIGDLVILNDHINMMPNPLIGIHFPEFGERFVDMSEAYDKELISKAEKIAQENNIPVKSGCYVAVTGPTYETPAEYKFFRIIGGDMVGMSTVPEVIVANQIGIKCFAVSVITDLGVPGHIEYINHEIVQEAAKKAEPKLAMLINGLIEIL